MVDFISERLYMKNSIRKLSLAFLMALLGVVSGSQAFISSDAVFQSNKPITDILNNSWGFFCKTGSSIADYLSEVRDASVALTGIAYEYHRFTISVVGIYGLYYCYCSLNKRQAEQRNLIGRHCAGCYRGGGCPGVVGR